MDIMKNTDRKLKLSRIVSSKIMEAKEKFPIKFTKNCKKMMKIIIKGIYLSVTALLLPLKRLEKIGSVKEATILPKGLK